LFRRYGSYFTILRNSSRSHISVSEYGLCLLVLFSFILAKVGVIQSDCGIGSALPL
jgi:hypothetical protein